MTISNTENVINFQIMISSSPVYLHLLIGIFYKIFLKASGICIIRILAIKFTPRRFHENS